MRRANAIFTILILLLFLVHMIWGGMELAGMVKGGSSVFSCLSYLLMALIGIHIFISAKLTIDTVLSARRAGFFYWKENRLFLVRRISGLDLFFFLLIHVLLFTGDTSGEIYRLKLFDLFGLVTQIGMVLSLLIHLTTNVRPLKIALGLTDQYNFKVDIVLIFSFLLLLAGIAFFVYYLRWQVSPYIGIRIENAQDISKVIRKTMLHRSQSVKITFDAYTSGTGEMKALVDHLITGAFYESEDPHGGDYLRYQYGGYELRHHAKKNWLKYSYQARIIPVYFTTSEQEEAVDEQISQVLQSFALKEDASEYEKIRCVRNYICKNVNYDTVHKHMPGSSHIQSTAYGALHYHTALCQGYAVLCYRLLKELGVDVRIITGNAVVSGITERHAWNIVKIGDVYYNLDITLDDVSDTEDYFLKSDTFFLKDHFRDTEYQTDLFYSNYPMSKENYLN